MIQLTEDWRADADSLNWVLQKRTRPKEPVDNSDREDRWSTEGYYPTFAALMRALVEKSIKIPSNLTGIQAKIDEIYALIQDRLVILDAVSRGEALARIKNSSDSEELDFLL